MKIKVASALLIIGFLTGCGHPDNHYQGYIEGENIYLASPYSGNLVEALVERGQAVKKGELLFKLDPYPQMLEINQASASLKQGQEQQKDLNTPRRPQEIAAINAQIGQATAQIALAQLRLTRNQVLYEKHVLDKDSLDASRERHTELMYAKAQLEATLALAKEGSRKNQIQAQQAQVSLLMSKLSQSKWELAQKSFYAPADGVIFDTYFRKGEFVDSTKAVAALLTAENIRVEFFVPARTLARLHVGQKINFDCEGCTKNNPATIRYISPEAEYVPPLVYSRDNSDKLVFRVKASIGTPANFKPGQPVMVVVADHE